MWGGLFMNINNVLSNVIPILFLLLVASTVSAQILDVQETSLNVNIHQGEILTRTINVDNTGITPIELTFSHNLDLVDNDGDSITIQFSDPGIIAPGDTASVTITIDADQFIDLEDYSGILTVKDKNSSAQDTLTISIIVEPDVCDFGVVGNDLQLTIEQPDSGDKFNPGDSINIRADVKNVGDDDIRTSVEAFLFNNDRSIADATAEDVNIEDGEEETFRASLEIPIDPNDVDEDEPFMVVVKAFDEDDEQLNCIQHQIPVDLKLKDKQIIIEDEETTLLPQQAMCNDEVIAKVGIVNAGEDELSSVIIGISSQQLSLNQQNTPFQLDGFDSKDRNTATKSFSFTIPSSVKQGVYNILATVTYDGNKITHTMPLTVLSCPESEQKIIAAPSDISLSLETDTITATDTQQQIMIRLKNNLGSAQTVQVRLSGLDRIASSYTNLVSISALQTRTLLLPISIDSDADPGTYTGSIDLFTTTQSLLSSKPLTIIIPSSEPILQEEKAFFDQIPTSFWVVINVTLIALLLLTVKTVMLRK